MNEKKGGIVIRGHRERKEVDEEIEWLWGQRFEQGMREKNP